VFVAAAITAALTIQSSAQALTLTECSAKYKDAKAAGTLNGATWNDFRKSQCDASGNAGTAKRSAAPVAGMMAIADAVFPSVVD
jgi:PAB1-binding protein PBP1